MTNVCETCGARRTCPIADAKEGQQQPANIVPEGQKSQDDSVYRIAKAVLGINSLGMCGPLDSHG